MLYLERNEKTQREKLFDQGFFSVNMDKMITGITYLKVKIYFLDIFDCFSFLHEYIHEVYYIEHASILYLIFIIVIIVHLTYILDHTNMLVQISFFS